MSTGFFPCVGLYFGQDDKDILPYTGLLPPSMKDGVKYDYRLIRVSVELKMERRSTSEEVCLLRVFL